jgi:hypothetical protein
MKAIRRSHIPFDHVVAQVAAFPFASEAAFGWGGTTLYGNMFLDDTGKLWRKAEERILGGFPGFSVDEAVAIRDKLWFFGGQDRVSLRAYLVHLASLFLDVRGSVAVPQSVRDPSLQNAVTEAHPVLARRGWRWLSLELPPDLLLAALGGGRSGPDRIELLSPHLDRHLEEYGYAETHLHLGAALDFSRLWLGAVCVIADQEIKENQFSSPGAVFGGGSLLGAWLVRAALARYLLARFLVYPHEGSFETFLAGTVRNEVWRDIDVGSYALIRRALGDLLQGEIADANFTFAHYQNVYAQLTGVRVVNSRQDMATLWDADPIARFMLTPIRDSASPEARFVAAALAYLEEQSADELFARTFWQVIRVRSLLYKHVVQRPMTPGLQWFVRSYARMRAFSRWFDSAALLRSAAVICGADRGLRSLEVRIGPSRDLTDIFTEVNALADAANNLNGTNVTESGRISRQAGERDRLEIGIVVHFSKDRGGRATRGEPTAHWVDSYADPYASDTLKGYRYASYYVNKKQEARSLAWVLRYFPQAIEIIRGVDVCTDELGVPNWVLVPIIQHVRETADAAAATLRRTTGRKIPPFRTTVHAGEDFVHLLTGLRLVETAIEHFELREGDRIGHGVALGVDPQEWAIRAGRVPMALEERLFDVVWEWAWYGRRGGDGLPGRRQVLEREIARASEQLFASLIPPIRLEQLASDLASPSALQAVGFPHWDLPAIPQRYELLHRFLTDRDLFHRGREIMWVDPEGETDTLLRLQREVREKLGERGISVEVNPTSNLLVGDMGDLTSHQLWRLRPPRNNGDAPPVSICVGSDDPAAFASNLREEYQWLADAMKLAGLSDEEAIQWLDRTRQCGIDARFTLPDRDHAEIREHPHVEVDQIVTEFLP